MRGLKLAALLEKVDQLRRCHSFSRTGIEAFDFSEATDDCFLLLSGKTLLNKII